MNINQKTRRPSISAKVKDEKGIVLIAVLCLLATLVLVGATAFIVASTDVKIGGNYKANQIALQAAMAGVEQARETLRALNAASTVKTSFSDELLARVGVNGLLDGYKSVTDDLPLVSSTALVSGYTYNTYLTNDLIDGVTSLIDSNGIVGITSVATGPQSAKARIDAVVQLYSFPVTSSATLYSKDNISVSGATIVISGLDSSTCGGGSKAPIYTMSPSTTTTNGGPTLLGSPSTAQQGTANIDIQSYIDALKGGASFTLNNDVTNATYGSATNFVTVYSDAIATQSKGELKLTNVTGYGILLVKGDLELAGSLTWNGLILVTGKMKISGGGLEIKNIQGQIYAGLSNTADSSISGTVIIGYHSCNVKSALASQPLQIVSWKQNF